jgi:hypothetical protein
MKQFYISISDLRFALLCSASLIIVSSDSLARGDDLPVPILQDSLDNDSSVVMTQAARRWVIQLGTGNPVVLEAQANKLKADYPDARVVLISGQSKLIVGNWLSASDATSSLKTLRMINAQAFVRQLPNDTPSSALMANQTKVKPVKQLEMPAKSVVVKPVEVAVTSPVVEAKSLPEPEAVVQAQAVSDDDVLPAIVAVAVASKAELSPETPELQAAVALLEQEVPSSNPPEDNAEKHEPVAVESLSVASSEKRGIALPMREKEVVAFTASQPLVEPLNLMLSPLYLLPTDSNVQAQSNQSLTMQTVLEALVRPTLVATPTEKKVVATFKSEDPVLARKAKLFARMAELANAGLWEMALPLVKEAKLKDMQLSAVDNLLLGWVWLQNKEARVAKGYFQAALVQSPQDEARYALGLCYLLLGDNASAQGMLREMKSGKQKDHLRSLLLH